MRLALIATGSILALSLGACSPGFSGTTATGARATGVATTAPGAASQEPQSANSLPPGDTINGPITNNTGTIGGAIRR